MSDPTVMKVVENLPTTMQIIDSVIAFVFSLAAALALTWLTWRVMERLLSGMLGRGIGFIGSLFAAMLILASSLKVSSNFLARYDTVYVLQGMISGVVDTVSACITPKFFSPIEFLILVSFGIYLCYWLHTRFAPKHTIEDLKQKLEYTVESEEPPKPPYPY